MKAPPVDLLGLVDAIERDPALAKRLAVAVAPYVFGAAALAASRPAGVYSSRKGHGAPGYSEEESKRVAQRIGTRRGRWLVYTSEQLAEYERAQTNAPAPLPSTSTWHPSQAAKGLRVVGRK